MVRKERNVVKRTIFAAGMAAALFVEGIFGVRAGAASAAVSNETSDYAAETETETLSSKWMESRQPFGENEAVWYLPNQELEEMTSPELYWFDGSLLAVSSQYDENGAGRVVMKRISLEDGTLEAKTEFDIGNFITVQISGSQVGVCDLGKNQVRIFDGSLKETAAYLSVCANTDNTAVGYLGSDMKTLYLVRWEHGITRIALEDGSTTELLENVRDVCVNSKGQTYLAISYLNLDTQRNICKILNLETGTMEELPVKECAQSAVCADGVWLLTSAESWKEYWLVDGDSVRKAEWSGIRASLVSPQARILTVDAEGRTFSLYRTDGSFLSECRLPKEGDFAGLNQIWDERWNGYFFMVFEDSQYGKLVFWDPDASTRQEADFPLENPEEPVSASLDASLYERAEEIGSKYGMKIRIADQCKSDYEYYTVEKISDSEAFSTALDTLEHALQQYPQGFLEQLLYGKIPYVQIELTGSLYPKENAGINIPVAAFTDVDSCHAMIVFDASFLQENTVYHEITHAIDKRLEWDASLRDNALFQEDTWQQLNPDGFSYADSYLEMPDSARAYLDSGYFAYEYSMTNSKEDRATMMEIAMISDCYQQDPVHWVGIRKKLDYYSRCIRDCFHTDGWPETTAWERVLR